MRIVFEIQAQKFVVAFLWKKTRCAHDVDMGSKLDRFVCRYFA
ncbi:hypothetical protein P608_20485 [Comamonas thiooxydans]|uniref:Uncharacterized protein n=1 Tax=Comamonas thiooxydans TaxID=363952 RepID=A0A0E3BWR3_9BURK|nr:hypothetical protein P608_20485 [Comamonas thiooxydans]KGH20976.1 hypothetical protein P607_09255 [Comamonas thiooxydans]KGH23946.1 hypothetical protein P606_10205 [Comamonas thiooxydans]